MTSPPNIPRRTPREQVAAIVSRLRSADLTYPVALAFFEIGQMLKALEIELAEMGDDVTEPLADASASVESLCSVIDTAPNPGPRAKETHRSAALQALAQLQSRLLQKEVL